MTEFGTHRQLPFTGGRYATFRLERVGAIGRHLESAPATRGA